VDFEVNFKVDFKVKVEEVVAVVVADFSEELAKEIVVIQMMITTRMIKAKDKMQVNHHSKKHPEKQEVL